VPVAGDELIRSEVVEQLSHWIPTRTLNDGQNGGGNVQLHEPNPSTTGPDPSPDEATMCAGVAEP
jgi:hypothetical protein